jgi:hypothetical protein
MTFDPELLQRLRQLQTQVAEVKARISSERFAQRLLGSRVLELQWRLRQLGQPVPPEAPGLTPDDLAAGVLKALTGANARLAEEKVGATLVISDLEVSVQGTFTGAATGLRFLPHGPAAMGARPLGNVHLRAGQVPTPTAAASGP